MVVEAGYCALPCGRMSRARWECVRAGVCDKAGFASVKKGPQG